MSSPVNQNLTSTEMKAWVTTLAKAIASEEGNYSNWSKYMNVAEGRILAKHPKQRNSLARLIKEYRGK